MESLEPIAPGIVHDVTEPLGAMYSVCKSLFLICLYIALFLPLSKALLSTNRPSLSFLYMLVLNIYYLSSMSLNTFVLF